jgi:hypothetical protein
MRQRALRARGASRQPRRQQHRPGSRTERRTSARALLGGGRACGRPRAARRAALRGGCRPLRPSAVLSRARAAGAPCEHAPARARRCSSAAAPRAPARRTSAAAARRPCGASPRASGCRPTCERAQAASQRPRGGCCQACRKQAARRARARCGGPATHRTQRARWPMKPQQSVQAPLRTLGLVPVALEDEANAKARRQRAGQRVQPQLHSLLAQLLCPLKVPDDLQARPGCVAVFGRRVLPGLPGKQVARRARARCRGPVTHRSQRVRARWLRKPQQSVQAPLETLELAPLGLAEQRGTAARSVSGLGSAASDNCSCCRLCSSVRSKCRSSLLTGSAPGAGIAGGALRAAPSGAGRRRSGAAPASTPAGPAGAGRQPSGGAPASSLAAPSGAGRRRTGAAPASRPRRPCLALAGAEIVCMRSSERRVWVQPQGRARC